MRDLPRWTDDDWDNASAFAAEVYRAVDAAYAKEPVGLSAIEQRLWHMHRMVALNGITMHLLATRPEDSDGQIDPYWLLPLAMGIAARWRVQPGDRALLARYARETDCDYDGAKVAVMLSATLVVQATREMPTTVRLGGEWLTDESGRKQVVNATTTLDYIQYVRWFVGRSLREARAILREGAVSDATSTAHEDRTPASDAVLLDALIEREQIDAIYAAARDDTDRALLDSLADGVSIAEAARGLGVNVEAAKKRVQRLRKRLRAG